jgi:hypothetical protein
VKERSFCSPKSDYHLGFRRFSAVALPCPVPRAFHLPFGGLCHFSAPFPEKTKAMFAVIFSTLNQGCTEMRSDCLVLIRQIRLMKKLRNCGTKANIISDSYFIHVRDFSLGESND